VYLEGTLYCEICFLQFKRDIMPILYYALEKLHLLIVVRALPLLCFILMFRFVITFVSRSAISKP
jgi:hypothetical protein